MQLNAVVGSRASGVGDSYHDLLLQDIPLFPEVNGQSPRHTLPNTDTPIQEPNNASHACYDHPCMRGASLGRVTSVRSSNCQRNPRHPRSVCICYRNSFKQSPSYSWPPNSKTGPGLPSFYLRHLYVPPLSVMPPAMRRD